MPALVTVYTNAPLQGVRERRWRHVRRTILWAGSARIITVGVAMIVDAYVICAVTQ
jgi:hypothetical protein